MNRRKFLKTLGVLSAALPFMGIGFLKPKEPNELDIAIHDLNRMFDYYINQIDELRI